MDEAMELRSLQHREANIAYPYGGKHAFLVTIQIGSQMAIPQEQKQRHKGDVSAKLEEVLSACVFRKLHNMFAIQINQLPTNLPTLTKAIKRSQWTSMDYWCKA